MHIRTKSFFVVIATLLTAITTIAQSKRVDSVPSATLLRIVKAEDERRWDSDLRNLLTSANPAVRSRAALAAGRIGNESALPELSSMLANDKDQPVRAMAAFAIGEVESALAANSLLTALKDAAQSSAVRARAIEALGKIAAALPKEQQARAAELGAAILNSLKSATDREEILLGITAVLRSKPADAGPVLDSFLSHKDARIRADAGNALARLRLKDGNAKLQVLLISDADPVVRANAARVLGATEEKAALEKLLEAATKDSDSRVRVSAIRSLAALKDARGGEPLLQRGLAITDLKREPLPSELNEALEIATALGRLYPQKADPAVLDWLHKGQIELNHAAPEVEVSYVRVSPDKYLSEFGSDAATQKRALQEMLILHWRSGASIASALGEISNLPATVANKPELMKAAESLLQAMLDYKNSDVKANSLLPLHTEYGVPDVLRAYALFKPNDLVAVLKQSLDENDVIVRATAADLIGDLPPSEENTALLVAALPRALKDELNDAAISVLNSLAKQKSAPANEAIKSGLDSADYVLRKRAAAALKANGVGDFSARVAPANSRNTSADYRRALARLGKNVRAVVTTTKGSFTIELLPDLAPLTVDNFVQLATKGYYRGIVFHRVVPNFVIQAGDPRGDGNGGPGYAIRCEINEVPYERAAVGMALSGKDTGGSQWFVTHAPQPHLDGGYTVFGKVVSGMNVVDAIVRGDVIRSITIR